MSPDLYSLAGMAAMAAIAGVIGLRLVRDESALRRKRVLAEKH
ncbi:MAG TPA: hypothetical protein VJ742_09355 [Nitrososphaera sp.]|jgi:hypothetical protein|nr:hypothetical protein [Nitrososphaera sp.]